MRHPVDGDDLVGAMRPRGPAGRAERRWRGCDVTPMPDLSSRPSGGANASPKSVRCPRSAPSAIASTPWPKPSTATTSPNSSTDPPEPALENRRRRRTGHPELGPLAQHQPPPRLPQRHTARESKPPSTLQNGPTNPWSKSNSPSLHQNQGDSVRTLGGILALLRRADRDRIREFGIHESDGAPDEKKRRPKHQQPGYQACMMAR